MNPFRFQGPIIAEDPESGCTLVHREHVLGEILRLLEEGEYVTIVGPHQSGRTTLAIDLIDRLASGRGLGKAKVPVLVSCESLVDASRESLIRTILMRIARALEECPALRKRTPPAALLGSEESLPKTFVDLAPRLRVLGDAIKQSGTYSALALVVDEVEAMPDALLRESLIFFRWLFGDYAEKREDAPYRVVILATRNLAYLKIGTSSPYNIAHLVYLVPFSPSELVTLLDKEHAGKELTEITFDDAALRKIYTESGGHPYFIQRLCHILIEQCHAHGGEIATVTEQEVHRAVLELCESGEENLLAVYKEIPADSEDWALCKRIIVGYAEPYAAIDPAVSRLARRGIIRNVDHCCSISSGIYRRQILRRYFREEFLKAIHFSSDIERRVANVPCLQEILVNAEVGEFVAEKIDLLRRHKRNRRKAETTIASELAGFLDEILTNRKCDIDMGEVQVHAQRYHIHHLEERQQALSLLAAAFIQLAQGARTPGRSDKALS